MVVKRKRRNWLTAALPTNLVSTRWRRQLRLNLARFRFKAFLGIFKTVSLFFALAKLQPVAERFFQLEARCSQEVLHLELLYFLPIRIPGQFSLRQR